MIHDLDEFKNIPADYDSPLTLITEKFTSMISAKVDEEAHKVIARTALAFDMDEQKLIEILKQDSDRYREAYRRGYKSMDEEIIRCQECKHCDTDTLEHCWCMILARSREPDWFCGDGERRTE